MSRRYLYGPVDQDFADQNLFAARQEGHCLTFAARPGEADLALARPA